MKYRAKEEQEEEEENRLVQILGGYWIAMNDQRTRSTVSVVALKRVFGCILVLVFFVGFCFSNLPLSGNFRQQLISSWRTQGLKSISREASAVSITETVLFPDQALIFLKYPQATPLFTKNDIDCVYFSPNSSQPHLNLQPNYIYSEDPDLQIARCPLQTRGDVSTSIGIKSNGHLLSIGPTFRWDLLAYEALIDYDNTTIVFVKGLNLPPKIVVDPSQFECVYGRDFTTSNLLLLAEVISIGQEIVRCKTPLNILSDLQSVNSSIKVSVRGVDKPVINSVARPYRRFNPDPPSRKQHQMCVCTMLRNQARILQEWVIYHAHIGVQSWFIYDNNSSDDLSNLIESLDDEKFNITRHAWPWIKTQEAGFAHCALRAKDSCEWVGFIDVDEFLYFPSGLPLHDVIGNLTSNVAEVRVSCHNFGPSGLKRAPAKGVAVGYTCRMAAPERHKSIVRPEALNSTLINSVHHFHLRSDFEFVNMERNVLVINHYKYQVWEVFKEKFHRRVATYVTDWQDNENLESKDRTPGLGTEAVEPPDWSTRFCEVVDTGLRDQVVEMLTDPKTQMLPWQK